ncbi:hypothetical protein F4778DRAFT_713252 [Xylariomycetidae sp. FL2044]|nr:hypothetical protein F4778DRAFT_713252 [Xylariomycetidae sp. FL2044]
MDKKQGLAASRWADSSIPPLTSWPRPPPPSSNAHLNPRPANGPANAQPSPEQELSRFLKIVARLNWKMPFLNHGYGIATDRVGKTQQQIDANEIHFKIDFHEFYMLLERALVHLMAVYGVVVEAQYGFSQNLHNNNGHPVQQPNGGGSGGAGAGPLQHRYHANVLQALTNPANPLHEILGVGEAFQQLSRAKDLRNRWKYADDPAEPSRFMPAPLEAYNLETILQTIFAAFEQAYLVTERHVREGLSLQANGNGYGGDAGAVEGPVSAADWTTDQEDWGFMVEAMDWEAV